MKKAKLKIIGMHCVACENAIKNKLLSLNGVKDAKVSFTLGEAYVTYDDERIELKDIIREIQKIGYNVYKDEYYIEIPNLKSIDDERILRSRFEKLNGIIDLDFYYDLRILKVVINPEEISLNEIISNIKNLGYEIKNIKKEIHEDVEKSILEKEIKDYKKRILVAILCSIPIGFLTYSGIAFKYKDFVLFLLASIVMFYSASKFFKPAFLSLKNLSPSMDTLVILGTGVAYLYSTLDLFLIKYGKSFFEAPAFVITAILIGRYIETKLRTKATEAISKLSEVLPKNVRILKNGKETIVRYEDVNHGDIVLVKEGETIPVDGIIIDGEAYIDESIITGESKPVYKSKRDVAISGSLLKNGFLKILATRVGKEATIYQMIKFIRESSVKKPRVQKYIDKIVGKFTWLVILASIITFSTWLITTGDLFKSVLFASAVLVISCPCALGLASPLVYLVAVNKSLRYGILIKNPEIFEILKDVKYAFFDKTGTITYGRQRIINIKTFGIDENELIKLSAIAEMKSNHIIAKTIIDEAKRRNVFINDEPNFFESFHGLGVYAKYKDKEIIVGNEKLLKMFGIDVKGDENEYTNVFVAINGKLSGIISIADEIRKEAKDMISYLKSKGIEVFILSGDSEEVVKNVSKKIGVEKYYARVTPEEKVKILEEYRKYSKVMMVGDGINDAPALIKADVGIAVSKATDIAKASGSVVLLKEDLRLIKKLISLSKNVIRKIKFNILYAFMYNIILIPLAAGILYPKIFIKPEIAGVAMALSSISVTLNSLLLK